MADDPKFKNPDPFISQQKQQVFSPFLEEKKGSERSQWVGKGPEWAGARVRFQENHKPGAPQVAAAGAFAQTLRRYTSLNHLAQAARAVLQNTAQINQMLSDLNRVDFANVQVSAGEEGDERGVARRGRPQGGS